MSFSLLVRNARVVDGSGSPAFQADVGVEGERIGAIGNLTTAEAQRVVDAGGRVVCPGFIDVHSHSDLPLLTRPRSEPKIRQGITTELLGADGLSYAPLSPALLAEVKSYLAGLYGNPQVDIASESVASFTRQFDGRAATNTLYVVPHQALRLMTCGWRNGPATESELRQMRDLLEQGLAEGAHGLGTGLDYFPHGTCTTDELVSLCQVVARHAGVLVAHIRYVIGAVDAVREMVEISERSGVRVLVSHMRNAEALPIIDAARGRGVDIQFDTYPYNAGCSMFLMYLPFWAHDGGPTRLMERLQDRVARERLRAERPARFNGDLTTLMISSVGEAAALGEFIGRSLADFMQARGYADPVDAVCDLLVETDLAAGFIAHGGSTEDGLRQCITHAAHLASTDAVLVGRPHPRSYGTYPRYLGRYVREAGILSLEDCIRRMTSAPAACFGLEDRGTLRAGLAADLVLLNPDTVLDAATFEEPEQFPTGIDMVVVNGRVVVDGGEHTGALPGRALVSGR
ncbi:MAG: D-aminoacylase [Chloroflexi bacterium]|nr:D-aminoacylase [Chloroflexota bacterium]